MLSQNHRSKAGDTAKMIRGYGSLQEAAEGKAAVVNEDDAAMAIEVEGVTHDRHVRVTKSAARSHYLLISY